MYLVNTSIRSWGALKEFLQFNKMKSKQLKKPGPMKNVAENNKKPRYD